MNKKYRMTHRRRDFLKALTALGLTALPPRAQSQGTGLAVPVPPGVCGNGAGQPLFIPSDSGFLGRLMVGDEPLELRAAPSVNEGESGSPEFALTYRTRYRGKEYRNPT